MNVDATQAERDARDTIPAAERCRTCAGMGWLIRWERWGMRYVEPTRRERIVCGACGGTGWRRAAVKNKGAA